MKSTIAIVTILLSMGLVGSAWLTGTPANRFDAAGHGLQAQEATPFVRRAFEGPGRARHGTSLSPDGRYVAMSYLAVLDMFTGDVRDLGGQRSGSSGWSEVARFSPDGKRIAYTWGTWVRDSTEYDIRIVDTDGSNRRVIMPAREGEIGLWPDIHGWSPDGESLVVTFWADATPLENPQKTCLVSVADGSSQLILTTEAGGPNSAALSPDGRLLAYGMPRDPLGSEADVFVVPVDGGTPRLVAGGPSNDVPLGWAPDGSLLLYSDRELTEGVWRLRFRDGSPDGDLELLKGGLWGMKPVGVSGSRFAYGLRTQARQVHLTSIDLDRNRIGARLTPVEATVRESRVGNWSTDGRWLAFGTFEWGPSFGEDERRLHLQPLAGGSPREIAPAGLRVGDGAQWANGDRTLVTAAVSEGWAGYFAIDLAAGTAKRLLPVRDEAIAAGLPAQRGDNTLFSPELSTAYLLADSSILAVDLTTMEQRILASFDERTRGYPTTSGHSLAVWADRTLWIVDTRTGEKTALYNLGQNDPRLQYRGCAGRNQPLWTADGRFILFERDDGVPMDAEFGPTPCKVYKIEAEGGDPVLVGALPRHLGWALHPDGTRLALEHGENRFEIWIMEDLPGSR